MEVHFTERNDIRETYTPLTNQHLCRIVSKTMKLIQLTSKHEKLTLLGIVLLWLISIPGIIYGVNSYINSKDRRLRSECESAVYSIFADQWSYVDVVYAGNDVNYEQMPIPLKSKIDSIRHLPGGVSPHQKDLVNRWIEKYDDLYKLYRINPLLPENEEKAYDVTKGGWLYTDGWSLVRVRLEVGFDDIIISQSWLYPYAVGYKKQGHKILYDYEPSVKEAVQEAFNFITSNPDGMKMLDGCFKKGSWDYIQSKLLEADNEYYRILEDSIPAISSTSGESPFGILNLGFSANSFFHSYMYTDFYKVFIARSNFNTWSLYRISGAIKLDKERLLKQWLISSGCVFSLITILLSIYIHQKRRRANETDYQKLIKFSNPRNFMKPYNKDKVEIANRIFKEANEVHENDSLTINALIQRCTNELGVSFIDPSLLNELKRASNPKHFMKPYDAEKVKLANSIFAKLNSDTLSYAEFKMIREEVEKLNS